MTAGRILVVRLGAMGDILHALPAVAALGRVTWAVEPRWLPLLEGNPHIERTIPIDRHSIAGLRHAWRELRREKFERAFDLQGLFKSALVAAASSAGRITGFAHPRESAAAMFYSRRVAPDSVHVVDRNLELVGVSGTPPEFAIPLGRPEGALPPDGFLLASPLAGWGSKQWPLENYGRLAARLKLQMVVNGPPGSEALLASIPGAHLHISGIEGLIDATRRAGFVLGVDSGPLHLAAALGKPGVAIFGPTSPKRNGPYGGTIHVVRDPNAVTSYKRGASPDASMRAISADSVFDAIARQRAILVP